MSWNPALPVAITTGVSMLVGGLVAYKISCERQNLEEGKEKELSEVVHLLKVEDIAALLQSEDDKVKKAAEQFLLERASRREHLVYILHQCLSEDTSVIIKATKVIHMLTKNSDVTKAVLLDAGTMIILPEVIGKISEDFDYKVLMEKCKKDVTLEKILTNCIAAIFQLTLHDTVTTLNFCKETSCIRNIFLNILGDHGYHISTDIKRWSTFLIHQLAQCDLHPIKKSLRKWGIIRKTTFCLIKTLGDILQTQLCLQILVHYLNDSVEEIVQVCQEMATLDSLPHLVGLLRCDEEENVVQLSAVIIHHFCCFDLEISRLSSLPGIVKILFNVLNTTEANIQKTILRICNYLSVSSSKFRKRLINHQPMIKKLSICLASGNADVVYGSLMLIHDLAMSGKHSVQKLVHTNPDIITSLVKLSLTSSGETVQLLAETLGFICSCESLHSFILRSGVVNAILHFAKSGDVSVQFWASALLLNLSMISDEVKDSIIRNGGVHILLEMAVSGDDVDLPDISTNAAKTLVILGFLENKMEVSLASGLEGSIIIDGTEHCPGKQGINLVTLDFMKFKYSKGLVVQPHDFLGHVSNCTELLKSGPLFAVTQGDCTVSKQGEKLPETVVKYLHHKEDFLGSPAWCLMLMSGNAKVTDGEDNLEMKFQVFLREFLNVSLKENFTDPLIDVLLSVPPSSTINKTDDLELIEILARHSFQRKSIVATPGFLEYLNELIWSISSLNTDQLMELENATKVSHCIAALKILHLCSIDKDSVKELSNRGLLRALVSLILSIVPGLINKQLSLKHENHEQKLAWFDLIESKTEENLSHPETFMEDEEFDNTMDDLCHKELFDISLSNRLDRLSNSNDDLFITSGHDNEPVVADRNQPRSRTVTYADEVEYLGEDEENYQPTNPTQRRLRTDSFILRTDSRNMRRDRHSRSRLERPFSVEPSEEQPAISMMSPARSIPNRPISADHEQMRRISRSMSISLQQSKSTEEAIPELANLNEVLQQLVKHSVMITYHLVQHDDNDVQSFILNSYLLPLLHNVLCCLRDPFKQRIGLAVSSSWMKLAAILMPSTQVNNGGVIVQHTHYPRSCIVSSDSLETSNENWYFESLQANQPVGKSLYANIELKPKGWYYEVVVLSDGILQIGWANENCVFNPEKGIGVGDNFNSCGYDGARCKLWNGPSKDIVNDNDYGIEWQSGDVISVLLSWDGVLSFWLNGKDLGKALDNIDTSLLWYPAVSLSIDQHCLFVFHKTDFRYKPPEEFHSISDVHAFVHKTDDTTSNVTKQQNLFDMSATLLPDATEKYILCYFEVNVQCDISKREIDLGYIHVYDSDEKETVSQNACNSEESGASSVKKAKFTQTVSTNAYRNENREKVNIFGCGISLPKLDMFITADGDRVFSKSLMKISSDAENSHKDFLLKLIPFVSMPNAVVNFGQKDFVYEKANSVLSKHLSMEHIGSLIDDIDR